MAFVEGGMRLFIVILSMNAALLVGSMTIPGFPPLSASSSLYALNPPGLSSPASPANTGSLTPTALADTNGVVTVTSTNPKDTAPPLTEEAFQLVPDIFNVPLVLLFGVVFLMASIGLPQPVIWLVGTPIAVFQFFALLYIAYTTIAALRGGSVL